MSSTSWLTAHDRGRAVRAIPVSRAMTAGDSGAATAARDCQVRALTLAEIGLRIGYFHDATDEHLRLLGVGRDLLPSRSAWHEFYQADYARPLRQRRNYSLAWELDGQVVGFSTADQITFGEQAFMHLHILAAADRRHGLGAMFVRLSARQYFQDLELRRLYCQPNAFNAAPNRTLQAAGFRYVGTRQDAPSPINFDQPVTRWVLAEPPDA